MADILHGAAVCAEMDARTAAGAAMLRERGVIPTLGILRVGERQDDLAYERGAIKRCAAAGVEVRSFALPADASREELLNALDALNRDESVHGILLMRPLPPHLDGEAARVLLSPEKDVDGVTDASLAGVFTNTKTGFAPCTARAALAMLDHYGIGCAGKSAVVIGRSLVVGRPLAMLLLHRNATVTVCHTKTRDLPELARRADILITAYGAMESVGAEHLSIGQVVVDVGTSWNEQKGKLCGDARFDEAEPIVAAITPVPGGVGMVTASVLASHVVEAAARQTEKGRRKLWAAGEPAADADDHGTIRGKIDFNGESIVSAAARFAACAHRGQARKGTDIPYIAHPVETALILSQMGADEELIAAGLLHDTLEDAGVTADEIEERFGPRVRALVAAESEDKSLSWEERKLAAIEALKAAPRAERLLALADKLANMRAIAADYARLGDALWARFNRGYAQQAWYYRGLRGAFAAFSELDAYKEFSRLVTSVFGV